MITPLQPGEEWRSALSFAHERAQALAHTGCRDGKDYQGPTFESYVTEVAYIESQ